MALSANQQPQGFPLNTPRPATDEVAGLSDAGLQATQAYINQLNAEIGLAPSTLLTAPKDTFSKQVATSPVQARPLAYGQEQAPAPTADKTTQLLAAALLLKQQQAGGLPKASPNPTAPTQGLPPKAAASNLNGGQRNDGLAPNPNATPFDEPEEPFSTSANRALAAMALSTTIPVTSALALNALDGSFPDGVLNPVKAGVSPIGKLARAADNLPGLRWLAQPFQPDSVKKPWLRQLLGYSKPEVIENKVFGLEGQHLLKVLSNQHFPAGMTELMANQGLDAVLTQAPEHFPAWAKASIKEALLPQGLRLTPDLRVHLLESLAGQPLAGMKPEDLINKGLANVGLFGQVSLPFADGDALAKALSEGDDVALRLFDNHVKAALANPEQKAKLLALPAVGEWFEHYSKTELAKTPSLARHLAMEGFEAHVKGQVPNVDKLLEVNKELKRLKGGWSSVLNKLPGANQAWNSASGFASEAEAVAHLKDEALKALQGKVDPKLLAELEGTITTRKTFLTVMDNIEGTLGKELKLARNLDDVLAGFKGRMNRLFIQFGERYRDDYAMNQAMGSQQLVRQGRIASELAHLPNLTDDVTQQLATAMGQGDEALSGAVKSLGLTDEALITLSSIKRQTAGVKPLGLAGNTVTGLHNFVKRVMTGSIWNDVLPRNMEATSLPTNAKPLQRFMPTVGGLVGQGLFLFALPMYETLKADGGGDEKFKTFMRSLFGAGLGYTLGMWLVQKGIAITKLNHKLPMVAAHVFKPLMRIHPAIPVVGGTALTATGFLLDLVLAGIVGGKLSAIGEKVSDTLFGKPLHVQRTEAKDKYLELKRKQDFEAKKADFERKKQAVSTLLQAGQLPMPSASPLAAPALRGQGGLAMANAPQPAHVTASSPHYQVQASLTPGQMGQPTAEAIANSRPRNAINPMQQEATSA